ASRSIIGSSVRPWVLIWPGIKEGQRSKIHCRVPHPLEHGILSHRVMLLRRARLTPRYCWPTPKCRNWCIKHTFFEGKKVEETSPRKSTPRTLKEVGQQDPPVICTQDTKDHTSGAMGTAIWRD